MDRENVIEQREVGDYRITIFRDDCPMCPTKDWDQVGLFIWEFCEYRGMTLSSYSNTKELSCEPHSLEEALKDLVCKYVPQKEIIKYINDYSEGSRFRYDKSNHVWSLDRYSKEAAYDGKHWHYLETYCPDEVQSGDIRDYICDHLSEEDFKYLLQNCQKEIAYTEFSTSGYCQGDYAEGIAYCDIERFKQMCNTDTKDWRKRAVEIMDAEAETLGKWMCGDVYCFVLEKREKFRKTYIGSDKADCYDEEWDEIASCSGYYNEPDEIIDMVIEENNLSPKSAA